jgi:alkylation response protein AidB-like acyl-CoA dehydrogenase
MDFSFTPEQEAYRQTIRDFVKRHCPPELDRQLEVNVDQTRDGRRVADDDHEVLGSVSV